MFLGRSHSFFFFGRKNRFCKVKLILPAQPILPLRDPAYPVPFVIHLGFAHGIM